MPIRAPSFAPPPPLRTANAVPTRSCTLPDSAVHLAPYRAHSHATTAAARMVPCRPRHDDDATCAATTTTTAQRNTRNVNVQQQQQRRCNARSNDDGHKITFPPRPFVHPPTRTPGHPTVSTHSRLSHPFANTPTGAVPKTGVVP